MKINYKTTTIVLIGILLIICVYYCINNNTGTITNVTNNVNTHATTTPNNTVGLANPASKNCKAKGGTLKIEKRPDGAEYGLCYFEENRACEEWSMYNGECPVGGRRTTGYDTIDQNYCAWNGGETFAVPNSKCAFKNGKVCSTVDFYNGKCSKQI